MKKSALRQALISLKLFTAFPKPGKVSFTNFLLQHFAEPKDYLPNLRLICLENYSKSLKN